MKFSDYQENSSESKVQINMDFNESKNEFEKQRILCNHCKRTLDNGIRCLGICVADNEY